MQCCSVYIWKQLQLRTPYVCLGKKVGYGVLRSIVMASSSIAFVLHIILVLIFISFYLTYFSFCF